MLVARLAVDKRKRHLTKPEVVISDLKVYP